MATRSRLAVLLHADIVGSTEHVQHHEEVAHERFRDAFRRFAETIAGHDGTALEVRGDALVAEFERASDALTAALEFQSANYRHNRTLDGSIVPFLRIGIAVGDAVIADNTVTGAGVVLAQRIEQLAGPGEVCISAAVREAVSERLPVQYRDLGQHRLKGFQHPQQVFGVEQVARAAENNVAQNGDDLAHFPAHERPSIAVLPFQNRSSDPEQEFFGDGMSEDIITALSRMRWLMVVSRTASFAFKGQSVPIEQIASKLGVRYLLEGSLRRAGPRIRITAQLLDAESGNHLWAERYDRNLDDIFAIQDEITDAIVSAIEPAISAEERRRALSKSPRNVDAWVVYQRGLSLYYHGNTAELKAALEQFKQAINLEPGFAAAHAMHAECTVRLLIHGAGDDRDAMIKHAMQAAHTSVRLDPQDPSGYVSLGWLHSVSNDPSAALAPLDRALTLNARSFDAYHARGHALNQIGRYDEAIKDFEQAILVSPNHPYYGGLLTKHAIALLITGCFEEAAGIADRAISGPNRAFYARATRAAALTRLGRSREAAEMVRQLKEHAPEFSLETVRRGLPSFMDIEKLLALFEQAGIQPLPDGDVAPGSDKTLAGRQDNP